jgi:hypothetical protein
MNGAIKALILIGAVAACKPSADVVKHDVDWREDRNIREIVTMPLNKQSDRIPILCDYLLGLDIPPMPIIPDDFIGYSPRYPERYAGQSTDLEIPDFPEGYPFER